MKNRLIDKIFGLPNALSRNDLEQALSNKDSFDFQLEYKLIGASFDDDALEGFKLSRLKVSDMDNLDQKMQNLFSSSSTDGFQKWFLSIWGGLFALMLSTAFLLTTFIGKNQQSEMKNLQVNDKINNEQAVEREGSSIAINPEEQKERFTIIISKYNSKEQSKSEQQTNLVDTHKNPRIDDLPERIQVKTAELLNMRSKDSGIKKSKAKEIALHNHIFIDFRGIRADQTFKIDQVLTGTSANYSNQDSKNTNSEVLDGTVEIPYHDYLSETALLLKSNDFKFALKQFNVILKYYPNDENALFYGAYCLYQLGLFKESLDYLERLSKSTYSNFDEEMDWYLLKCYSKLNKSAEAKQLAEKIVENGGFYSEQAQDFLKKR